jgi:hypothetical protein
MEKIFNICQNILKLLHLFLDRISHTINHVILHLTLFLQPLILSSEASTLDT